MSAAAIPGEPVWKRSSDRAVGSSGPAVLVGGVLEALRAVMAGAPSVGAVNWPWEERAQAIATLDRVSELVGVYRAGLLSAHKADGRWARAGDRSFEGFRGRTAKTGPGAARREMELAEGLTQMPQAAKAVEDGQVALAHAGVLSRLRARASEPVREALAAGGADELLSLAKGMDAAAFAKRAEAWAAGQDAAAVERSHQDTRRRRYCRISDRDGGTRLEGFVDVVAGAMLRTALEALTPVPAADDGRTPDQRRADALTAMAGRVLDQGADKIGAQIRPHISLLVPAETWAVIRRRRRTRAGGGDRHGEDSDRGDGTGRPGHGSGQEDGSGQAGPIPMPELEDGTVVPLSEIERIACDCELTRLVLDADGIPLDIGRTQRPYTKSLRRAVLTRDRHCRWPGCTMRASWCDVHHIRWYSRGGTTSLTNGLTLCSYHHHQVHRHDITIRAVPGGHSFTRRDGTDLGTSHGQTTRPSRPLVPTPPPAGSAPAADTAPPGAPPNQAAAPFLPTTARPRGTGARPGGTGAPGGTDPPPGGAAPGGDGEGEPPPPP